MFEKREANWPVRLALLGLAVLAASGSTAKGREDAPSDAKDVQAEKASGEPAAVEHRGAEHESGHHAGAHEHLGAAGANASPAEFRSDLAIYSFVIFALLMVILYKFAWGPIAAGLDAREARIAENIAAAQRSHDEAKVMLADYERKLARAQEEVRSILDEARRDAAATQQEMIAKAREDAAAEVARGRREIETATAQALKLLSETSANAAVDLASKILKTRLSPADHARLVSEALDQFTATTPSRN